ncbi:conserved hypothetical protein [Gammaproteobacteria bacterium]
MENYRSFHPSTSGQIVVGGAPVVGTIETANGVDWFSVTLTTGRNYQFGLERNGTSGLFDPYLELYNNQGHLIAQDDDSGGELNSLLAFTSTDTDTYYLRAKDYSCHVGNYRIGASVDDHPNSVATDAAITVGNSATGTIERPGDSDWFRVTLNTGYTYTIRLRGEPSNHGTLTDPFLAGVYDASGNYVPGTTNDDFGSSTESNLIFTPTISGTYYLSAAAVPSQTGTYTLTVTGQHSPADLPASTATTATIALGGTLHGMINTPHDVDWVKSTLTAGHTYTIELNTDSTVSNPLMDPSFVGIYNNAGIRISGTSNDDYGVGFNSRVTFTPTSSGTYYLAAGGYGDNTGAYELRLSSAITSSNNVGNTVSTAASLPLDTPRIGTIDSTRDVDWYKVSLSAGHNYSINVHGVGSGAGTLIDPELIGIYNSVGAIIPGTGNDDANNTLDSQESFRPITSGFYYLAVGAANDGTGSYTVSVETTTAASNDLPDNTTTTATARPDTPLTSTIDTPGDIDWIKISLTAGTTYQLDLRGAATHDGSLSDPLIYGVYNANGLALPGSSNDDNGTGNNAQVTLTAPHTGNYFVAAGGYGMSIGSYELALTVIRSDTTAPTLLATSPSDNAQNALPGSNLTLSFSELVQAGSGNITIRGGGTTRTIAVTDTDQISFNGSAMTINPSTDLTANTDYTVTFGAGVVRDLAGNSFSGITSTSQFNFHTTTASTTNTWTVMVYLAADNDLEPFAIADINEMEEAILPSNVHVAALVDRAPGYDTSNGNWTDTREGPISHDTNLTTIHSALTSIGEQDTGNGITLTNFINTTATNYPAQHYALIVWDHGGGLSGTAWDDTSGDDNLTLAETRTAITASSVPNFDFIGFDACLQGMVEQACELRNHADVVVASQELIPGDGWDYYNFLSSFTGNQNLTPYDLANAAVETYGQYYTGESDITLSATRTDALPALKSALNGFVSAAITAGSTILPQLQNAAERTIAIDHGDEDYRDLGDFMHKVVDAVTNTSVRTAAAAVTTAINNAVLAHVGTVAGATGLSIYLPLASIDDSYVSNDYLFLQGTTWGNFLRFILNDQHGDNLIGDASNNDLRGFGGNDTLGGGAGNDTLDGGTGTDMLIGGAGKDTLTGGAGHDTFDFNALSEMGVTSSTRDIITDFTRGQDRIDLSTLDANQTAGGNQAFSAPVVGGTFSAVFASPGDLYFDNVAHVLYGNTNTNAAAEFSIQLTGVTTLNSSDLIL